MTAPAWQAGQGSPGAARSTGSQELGSLLSTHARAQIFSKGLPKWKGNFYFKSIQKKKKNPNQKTNPQSLVSHKEREERKKKDLV